MGKEPESLPVREADSATMKVDVCQIAIAPSNGPTWSQKNKDCLNKFNDTPDGKLYNFLSPLSMIPGWGPNWKESVGVWPTLFAS